APKVDAEDPLPIGERLIGDAAEGGDAGVVAEDVDAAVALPHLVRERLHRLGLAHVGDVAVRFGAARAQLGHRAIERAALDVGEDDGESFPGEAARQGEPDPRGAAGDDGDLTLLDLRGLSSRAPRVSARRPPSPAAPRATA